MIRASGGCQIRWPHKVGKVLKSIVFSYIFNHKLLFCKGFLQFYSCVSALIFLKHCFFEGRPQQNATKSPWAYFARSTFFPKCKNSCVFCKEKLRILQNRWKNLVFQVVFEFVCARPGWTCWLRGCTIFAASAVAAMVGLTCAEHAGSIDVCSGMPGCAD